MPAAARARLDEGRRWLDGLDRRTVQLSAAQRRSLTASSVWIFLHVGFCSVLAAPIVGTAMLAFVVTAIWGGRVSPLLLGVSFAPLCGAALLGAAGLGSIRVRRRRLQLACSAHPPAFPGEPARCHVCAAPLLSDDRIVRCPHCEADNLVDASVLARLHDDRTAGLDDLERRLQHEVNGLRSASAVATAGTVLAAALSPVLAVALGLATAFILRFAELPIGPDLRYGLKDGCVAAGAALRASDLVGLRITDRYVYDTPTVEKVYLDPVMDEAYLRATNALGQRRQRVVGTCIAGPAWGRTLAKAQMPRQVQVVGDEVYYLAGNAERTVWHVPIEGGEAVQVPVDPLALDMVVYDGTVLVGRLAEQVEAGPAGVFRGSLNTIEGPGGPLTRAEGSVLALTLASDQLLWFDRDSFRTGEPLGLADLRIMPAAGGEARTIAARTRIPDRPSIAVAGDRVYWISRDNAILSVPLAGGAVDEVRAAGHPIEGLRVDGDSLYWGSGAGLNVRSLAGGPVGLVQPSVGGVVSLALTDRWLVIADDSLHRIVAVERSAITTRPAP